MNFFTSAAARATTRACLESKTIDQPNQQGQEVQLVEKTRALGERMCDRELIRALHDPSLCRDIAIVYDSVL